MRINEGNADPFEADSKISYEEHIDSLFKSKEYQNGVKRAFEEVFCVDEKESNKLFEKETYR